MTKNIISSSDNSDNQLIKYLLIFLLTFSSGVVAESVSRLAARGLRLWMVVTELGENGASVHIPAVEDW